ncbi:MAG: hypothetical protein IMY71_13265, partial [Bacteroidetes bacterium]|nr:hypothetical protein [Bacteroidota bacterium]
MNILKSFFLSIILCLSLFAQSQTPEFEKFTPRDGLIGRDVECIYQDSYGFMWFGTWMGINRYDGTEFRFYEIFPAHPRFVSSNFVSAITEDSYGYLWIGTLRGLIRLDPFSGRTLTFLHNKNNPDTPSHNFVTSIFIDRENIIWFGTQGGGLNKLITDPGGQNPEFSHYLFEGDTNKNIRNNSVYSVYGNSRPDNDLLWVGTANGLIAFNKKNEQYRRYIHNPDDNTSLPSNEISVIHEDKQGQIWIGTDDGFICSINKTSKGNYFFNNYLTDTQSKINHIADADSHSLWLAGNIETGLINFDTKTGKVDKFFHDPENPKSIHWNSIYALYKDCSGILWVGAEGALNYFNPQKIKFRQFLALP